jgi:flagellar assembly protein FliH
LSKFDPLFHRSPKNPPNSEVLDFEPEHFTRLEGVGPIPDPNEDFGRSAPPKGPAPDPFEKFKDERRASAPDPLAGLPSLDGLFRPFDLTSEGTVQTEFADLHDPGPATFIFEDMDTRDPDVVRTLAHAEEISRKKIMEAEEKALRLTDAAETEARACVAEAEAEAKTLLERAKIEAEESVAHIKTTAANDQAAAAAGRAEAESRLAAVADRIAGLDVEWKKLDDESAQRKKALTEEEAKSRAALVAEKKKTLDEAQAGGHREGHARGLEEGRAAGRAEALKAFQDQIEGLIEVMSRMENIYQDLWAANGPMMIKLAIEAAEQILNKELREAPDLAARAFEACVDFLAQAHRVTFLARPQDIAQLEEAKADQRSRLGALVHVTFKPDDSLGPGDLIVESDVGRLDATVKHRSQEVMQVLRDAFEGTRRPLEQDEPPPLPEAAEEPLEASEELPAELGETSAATAAEAPPEGGPGGETA